MIVSCEASSKFHKRRFQNERFARDLFEVGSVWLEPHKVLGDICFGCLWLKNLGLG